VTWVPMTPTEQQIARLERERIAEQLTVLAEQSRAAATSWAPFRRSKHIRDAYYVRAAALDQIAEELREA
jgi:hypothetical protein